MLLLQRARTPTRWPLLLPALLLMLLLATLAEAREMVTVARDQVNMRSGAGTRHEPLWLLDRGYPLQVIGRRGDWLRVRDFERDVGWVYRPLTRSTPHHIVKAPVANVRSGPSTRTRIVGKLSYGDVVRTLERRAGWVKVRHESGLRGWIARRLLWGW
jgi:SH3-like domain-containing protein